MSRCASLQLQLVDCHNHLKAEEISTRRKSVSLIRDIMNAGLINILISDAFTQIEFNSPVSVQEKQGTQPEDTLRFLSSLTSLFCEIGCNSVIKHLMNFRHLVSEPYLFREIMDRALAALCLL